MSWIVRRKDNGAVICEVWSQETLAHINTAKYEAVPVLQHLVELNKALALQRAEFKEAARLACVC